MTCYNYCNGYSLMSYMEYPFILIQELILIFLVLKYKNMVNTVSIAGFGAYMAVLAAFALKIVPTVVLSIMAVSLMSFCVTTKHLKGCCLLSAPLHSHLGVEQNRSTMGSDQKQGLRVDQRSHLVLVCFHQLL